jgi:hypothetical protein
MTWESLETFQELVEAHSDLQSNQSHREAFTKFLNRMWTKPNTYNDFARAYMEFTTSNKLTFPKLRALPTANKSPARKRRSKRSKRRRSHRKRKR